MPNLFTYLRDRWKSDSVLSGWLDAEDPERFAVAEDPESRDKDQQLADADNLPTVQFILGDDSPDGDGSTSFGRFYEMELEVVLRNIGHNDVRRIRDRLRDHLFLSSNFKPILDDGDYVDIQLFGDEMDTEEDITTCTQVYLIRKSRRRY